MSGARAAAACLRRRRHHHRRRRHRRRHRQRLPSCRLVRRGCQLPNAVVARAGRRSRRAALHARRCRHGALLQIDRAAGRASISRSRVEDAADERERFTGRHREGCVVDRRSRRCSHRESRSGRRIGRSSTLESARVASHRSGRRRRGPTCRRWSRRTRPARRAVAPAPNTMPFGFEQPEIRAGDLAAQRAGDHAKRPVPVTRLMTLVVAGEVGS